MAIDYENLLSEIEDFRNSIGLNFVENMETICFDDINKVVCEYRE